MHQFSCLSFSSPPYPFFLLLIARRRSEKLPPSSLGIPLVGDSFALLRAMRNDRVTLFGCLTVVLSGPSANKFIFTAKDDTFINQQPRSIQRILGERTLLDVSGEDHKRLRNALRVFLRPEVWSVREQLVSDFQAMIDGVWSVPLNVPFTRFNRSLRSSNKARKVLSGLPLQRDLILSLVSIKDEDGAGTLSEEEIIDNVILVMVAGHDTSSILMTLLVRLLATDPLLYAGVYNEQVEVARAKASDEPLTWDDRGKMKYTWRLALETLRIIPPIFGSFKKAMRDIHYGGYLIPKGWQVACTTHIIETIFKENSKFDPMRSEGQCPTVPYSFVAFVETLVAIHYIVTKYDWTLACPNEGITRDPMPVPRLGLPIHLKPKKM
ncbi:hypothetical protein AMTRI_Chr02g214830 [Amborella trichopoda]